MNRLIRIFEKRREWEIWRVELEEKGEVVSSRERTWRATEKRLQRRLKRKQSLMELLEMDPSAFENFVADLFNVQGYTASAVGGTDDQGIDVLVSDETESLWAVAQCKRYAPGNRIGVKAIREFAGAFLFSGAKKGFYFTTCGLTRDAWKLVGNSPWLTVYDGSRLLRYIQEVEKNFGPENQEHKEGETAISNA